MEESSTTSEKEGKREILLCGEADDTAFVGIQAEKQFNCGGKFWHNDVAEFDWQTRQQV